MAPSIGATAFNCPHHDCGAYAQQTWHELIPRDIDPQRIESLTEEQPGFDWEDRLSLPQHTSYYVKGVFISECGRCNRIAIWANGSIAWPTHGDAPSPNPDLPRSVLEDYLEAGAIATTSPRGATALLRLAVDKLTSELEPNKRRLNDRIGELVKKGLNPEIQRALDIVRVVGNNAVHPGQIDLADDRETVALLFNLINLVADAMLTRPKQIQQMYKLLPEDARDSIEDRDGTRTKSSR